MYKAKYQKDYAAPQFFIDRADLHFIIYDENTIVNSKLHIKKNHAVKNDNNSLVLDGEKLQLQQILLDGIVLQKESYLITDTNLTVYNVPDKFVLETKVAIDPKKNTSLCGLYVSNDNYCTQCEAEGFHYITYFIDRPDILTRFTTTIVADKDKFPVLLSNGNLAASGCGKGNLHWAKWDDTTLKPAYLFALIAGKFSFIEDEYQTCSGRNVKLRAYAQNGLENKCWHALKCLAQSMKWDEEVFGLEYDLNIYMLIAIDNLNYGAMENKGLNIFNSKYLLVSPETATDVDYMNVARVVAHEYFHNWTGNRITCRDWFQLALKEGLTVFRENLFMEQNYYKEVQRINDVKFLKAEQFAEDSSAIAHPVRPKSYITVDNLYSYTVYYKGAEIPYMLKIFLGWDSFHKVMDLFFKRHDGKAVVVEDFIKCIAEITGEDFSQFQLWYDQAGTPILHVTTEYDQDAKTLTFNITQESIIPGNKSFYIPFVVGLLDRNGSEIPLQLKGEKKASSGDRALIVKEQTQEFCFINVDEMPIPSLLRNFSAPVKLDYHYTRYELKFLALYDTDAFNRWQAAQELFTKIIFELVDQFRRSRPLVLDNMIIEIVKAILFDSKLEPIVKAQFLQLPAENYLLDLMPIMDIEAIHEVSEFIKLQLAQQLREDFLNQYLANQCDKYIVVLNDIGKRALKNLLLYYLMYLDDGEITKFCLKQYDNADNMTDVIGSLIALMNSNYAGREIIFQNFYDKWRGNNLVVEKWLALNATIKHFNTLDRVKNLVNHPSFSINNPSKVYALLRTFAKLNPVNFHKQDGAGYEFFIDQIIRIDAVNPILAAGLFPPLVKWCNLDNVRSKLMHDQLQRLSKIENLSINVRELVEKALRN